MKQVDMQNTISIAILMTCHNRVKKTLECIKSIYSQINLEDICIEVILVDDGSNDNTRKLVEFFYPTVKIIDGDGTLFWNGGMHVAMQNAIEKNYDFYLWLNDDTILFDNSIFVIIDNYQRLKKNVSKKLIIVGSTKDIFTGTHTYGGFLKIKGLHPLKFKLIHPQDHPVECDNFHGNIVLIPNDVVQLVGNIDPSFHHQGGDHDYALRAKNKGVALWLAPGFLGHCARNEMKNAWKQHDLTYIQRMKIMTSYKCLPPRTRKLFLQRHGGTTWFFWWMAPYIKASFFHFYYSYLKIK